MITHAEIETKQWKYYANSSIQLRSKVEENDAIYEIFMK